MRIEASGIMQVHTGLPRTQAGWLNRTYQVVGALVHTGLPRIHRPSRSAGGSAIRHIRHALLMLLVGTMSACGGSSGGGSSAPPATSGQEFFINGADDASATSFWACYLPENVGTDTYWVVAFYTDATGYYLGGVLETSMTWSYTEPDVAFQLDGNPEQFEFKSVNRISALEFTTDLLRNGVVEEQRTCLRYNRDGTRSRTGEIRAAPVPRGRDSLLSGFRVETRR